MSVALGIDLGGTKIEIIALAADGRELLRRRRPTPGESYDATLDALASLVVEAERDLGVRGTLGVAHPGAISPLSGLLRNCNATALNGHAIDKDLMARLSRPIAFANDADCLALSEATDGAGADAEVVFAVILGSGVGGGLVVRKRMIVGANAIAGEWGHNPLPWPADDERPGEPCYCGRRGCIESWLAGRALAFHHRAAYGEALTAAEIAERAATGNADAEASMQRYEHRLARALATIVNILDPQAIVLGGGVSNIARLYANLPPLLRSYVFGDDVRTPIRRSIHGDSSGVRGAAWLGRDLA